MSFFTVVVLAAVLATVVALVSGISSMATDREVGHFDSAHWMEVSKTHSAECPPIVPVTVIGNTRFY